VYGVLQARKRPPESKAGIENTKGNPLMVQDTFQRPLRDLRISVTDRCNFRCAYCMPKEVFGAGYKFLPREEMLSFEEITRLVKIFANMGIRKIRLTGGEPLLRREIEKLVVMLAEIPDLELALTTNGSLLARKAQTLKDAGLDRVTVSLDSLEDEVFKTMNDVQFPVTRVLDGIEAAEEAGFSPIKINMVVKRGVNDHNILQMAEHFYNTPHVVRFIEYMDVGNTNNWKLEEVVPAKEIIQIIHAEYPIEPIEPNYQGEVAKRWRYKNGSGEIGLIASVTQPFCGDCTRARLSARGQLYTCLFAAKGRDLRQLLRSGATDEQIMSTLTSVWGTRKDRYSESRTENTSEKPKVEMSYIGG
jgi:cyclic pyranopterin phosphate synthase